MTRHDSIQYQRYLEQKYKGSTVVKNLADCLWTVQNTKMAAAIHELYSKTLPDQPSRFRDNLSLLFNNPDMFEVIQVSAIGYKVYGNRLPQPKFLHEFISDCDRFGYTLFWDKGVYKSYLLGTDV